VHVRVVYDGKSVDLVDRRTDGLDVPKEVEEMKDRLNELSLKSSYERIMMSENLVYSILCRGPTQKSIAYLHACLLSG
jgi:predicted choloylglycine hydrolase